MKRPSIFVSAVLMSLLPVTCVDAQVGAQDLAEISLSELLTVRAVTGARHDQLVVDSPRSISVLTAEDIRRGNYRSTPEAVSEVLGVFMQQTNDGGGSPIIRGLVGTQVLILVDGIRLNNSSYRLGPNQYLNTIDINQVERIEVLRGAGSVLYGSDALGGVVNIITRSAAGGAEGVSTRFFSRFSSANMGTVGRGDVSARSGPLAFVGGISLKQFGALSGGHQTGVQPLTGYGEWDADAKVGYQLSPNQQLTFAAQRVDLSDTKRADGVQAGTDLKLTWDQDMRSLLYAQYTARELRGPVDRVDFTVSYQRQTEHYNRITTAAPGTERQHFDQTNSVGANLQFASWMGPRHLFTYGVDGYQDNLTSRRDDVALSTGARRTAKGVLADGSRYQSWAMFVQDEIDVSPRLHLNLGTRYSSYRTRATVTDATTGTLSIDGGPNALTGSAHALFRLNSALHIVGGMAQGFRAPNVDDLSILGAFGGGYEVPNPRLQPESSLNFVTGVRGRTLRLVGSGTYFVTDIDGLIQRAPGIFGNKPFLDSNLNDVRDDAEPLVFQRQNAGRARLHGVELEGQWRLATQWTLAGTFVRILGEDQATGAPLRRVPPTHGTVRLGWSAGDFWVDGRSVFATHQTRLAPGDLTDVRIPAGGTPGFVVFHTRGGLRVNEAVQVTLGLENLTNRVYRTHGSGLDMPGTNFVAGINWTF